MADRYDLVAVFSPDSPVNRPDGAGPPPAGGIPSEPDGAGLSARDQPWTEADPPVGAGDEDAAGHPFYASGERGEALAELGPHVGRVLSATHAACEEMKREARADIEVRIAAIDAELARRRLELDGREQALRQRLQDAEDEAAARSVLSASATEEAERLSAEARADAADRLSSILMVQESIREQLDAASNELRRALASGTTGD